MKVQLFSLSHYLLQNCIILEEFYPDFKLVFDMEDDDKILRIESIESRSMALRLNYFLKTLAFAVKSFQIKSEKLETMPI